MTVTVTVTVTADGETGPARLGIIDWGIGGLGLVGLLDARAPGLPITYWSDAGTTPYGLQTTTELAARLRAVTAELARRGCTEVVLACNAASTVVDRLTTAAIPIEGIIRHGIAATIAADPGGGVVGVVGGARTIHAGAYRRGLAAVGRTVRSRVAQPLSAHIEAGRTGSSEFVEDLDRVVAPLRGVDALVLACTHYPAASDWFADAVPGATLVDPAIHLADAVAARYSPARGASPAERAYVTTGPVDPMRRAAALAWSVELSAVEGRTL